jgi:hypothetical protein
MWSGQAKDPGLSKWRFVIEYHRITEKDPKRGDEILTCSAGNFARSWADETERVRPEARSTEQ